MIPRGLGRGAVMVPHGAVAALWSDEGARRDPDVPPDNLLHLRAGIWWR